MEMKFGASFYLIGYQKKISLIDPESYLLIPTLSLQNGSQSSRSRRKVEHSSMTQSPKDKINYYFCPREKHILRCHFPQSESVSRKRLTFTLVHLSDFQPLRLRVTHETMSRISRGRDLAFRWKILQRNE